MLYNPNSHIIIYATHPSHCYYYHHHAAAADKENSSRDNEFIRHSTTPTTGLERINVQYHTDIQSQAQDKDNHQQQRNNNHSENNTTTTTAATTVSLTFQELGGCMSSTWYQYYSAADTVLYLVNTHPAYRHTIPTSTIQLIQLIHHTAIQPHTHIIIVLNHHNNNGNNRDDYNNRDNNDTSDDHAISELLFYNEMRVHSKFIYPIDMISVNSSTGYGVEKLMNCITKYRNKK